MGFHVNVRLHRLIGSQVPNLNPRTQTMVCRARRSLHQRRLLSSFSVKGRVSTPSTLKASNRN